MVGVLVLCGIAHLKKKLFYLTFGNAKPTFIMRIKGGNCHLLSVTHLLTVLRVVLNSKATAVIDFSS